MQYNGCMATTTTYHLFDGIDCGQNARPTAQLWKEGEGTHWGYSLDTGSGDDVIVLGFDTEDEARGAAYDDVRERMADAAADLHAEGGAEL